MDWEETFYLTAQITFRAFKFIHVLSPYSNTKLYWAHQQHHPSVWKHPILSGSADWMGQMPALEMGPAGPFVGDPAWLRAALGAPLRKAKRRLKVWVCVKCCKPLGSTAPPPPFPKTAYNAPLFPLYSGLDTVQSCSSLLNGGLVLQRNTHSNAEKYRWLQKYSEKHRSSLEMWVDE